MIGPPGAGKTMLARRLPTILPPLTNDEAIEVTRIYSVCGRLPPGNRLITVRSFRAPHHAVSLQALVGGGTIPRPGELSLARLGVLFLDELPKFRRDVLEALRQHYPSVGHGSARRAIIEDERVMAEFLAVSGMFITRSCYAHHTRDQTQCTCKVLAAPPVSGIL